MAGSIPESTTGDVRAGLSTHVDDTPPRSATRGISAMWRTAGRLVQRKPPAGLAAKLMLTEPLPASPRAQALTFSVGVSEYIFQREERDFGDLGLPLAKAIRRVTAWRGLEAAFTMGQLQSCAWPMAAA